MSFHVRRILGVAMALCLCLQIPQAFLMKVEAITPTYSVSSAYKGSSYYSALNNVTLTGNQRTDIVNVALSQVGYKEGSYSGDYSGADDGSYYNYTEYNYWYHNYVSSGMPVGGDGAPWCATFVSWCAEQANVPSSVLRRSTAAGHGSSYFNVNFYSGSSTLASSNDKDSYFKGYNYTPQKGDLFFTRSWSHVGLVVGVSGNYVITVEGNTNNNGSSQGNGVYKLTWRKIVDLYFGVPNYNDSQIKHTVDVTYGTNFTAYPKSKITAGNIYDASHNQIDSSSWIGASDKCTIHEVYTDGCCKVTYPLDTGGTKTVYSKISLFNVHTCDKGEYVYYEAAHPHYKCYKCSKCGSIWRNTQEATYVSSCTTCAPKKTIDSRYSSYCPIHAYPLSMGQISVYDASGTKYNNRYIDGATDECVIWEIYTDGWCKVRYPSSAETSGYFDAYVPLSTFTNTSSPSSWSLTYDCTLYQRSNLSNDYYSVTKGANCLLLSTDSSIRQIICYLPEKEYSLMGWISDPKQIHVSADTVNLTIGGTNSQTIYAWSTGKYNGETSLYFGKNGATNITCSWGSWTDGKAPLTITAVGVGTTELTIGVMDSNSEKVLDSTSITVTVNAKEYTVQYNANGGLNAPTSQIKYHDTVLKLSSAQPTRSGYTFLGWSTSSTATSAMYQSSSSFSTNANTTLYAIWKQEPVTLKKLEISSLPQKNVYKIGENLDTTGLLLKATYSDGSTEIINSGFTTSGFTSTTAGTKTVKVSYGGLNVSYTVTVKAEVTASTAVVTLQNAQAKAGDTVSVAVYIKDNPGIAYVKFKVDYSDALTLISAENKEILSGIFTTSQTTEVKPYILQWMGADNSTQTGCFVVLTFRVSEQAQSGTYNITMSCSESYNAALDDVRFSITNASVTVTAHIPGDVNGDGKVNGKDGVLLAQYLAGRDVTIITDAADVNGDGKINGKDGVILAQYLAGWNTTLK